MAADHSGSLQVSPEDVITRSAAAIRSGTRSVKPNGTILGRRTAAARSRASRLALRPATARTVTPRRQAPRRPRRAARCPMHPTLAARSVRSGRWRADLAHLAGGWIIERRADRCCYDGDMAAGSKRRMYLAAVSDVTRYRSVLSCTQSRCGQTSVQNTAARIRGSLL